MANYHGFTAFVVLAHVRARYFPPQIAGLGASITGNEVFRIDHDQAFNQTTHFQYQPWLKLPWITFNWRYDSGLVASNPNLDAFAHASGFLDADQQTAIGLFCVDAGGALHNASLSTPLAVGAGTICGANPIKGEQRPIEAVFPGAGSGFHLESQHIPIERNRRGHAKTCNSGAIPRISMAMSHPSVGSP